MQTTTQDLDDKFEPKPDAQALTSHSDDHPRNVSKNVDYEPHPESSVNISPEHENTMKHILNLYGGSASEEDMQGKKKLPLQIKSKIPKLNFA